MGECVDGCVWKSADEREGRKDERLNVHMSIIRKINRCVIVDVDF